MFAWQPLIPGGTTATPLNVSYRMSRIKHYLSGRWLDYGCAAAGTPRRCLLMGRARLWEWIFTRAGSTKPFLEGYRTPASRCTTGPTWTSPAIHSREPLSTRFLSMLPMSRYHYGKYSASCGRAVT